MRELRFFKGAMCEACEEQAPIVASFEFKHFGKVIVLRLNPNLKDYRIGKWSPKKTPSFVVLEGGIPLRKSEGELLDLESLERFVFEDVELEQDNAQHEGA